eukprot:COSAG03_NODE_1379_length_4206_cov_9.321889_3_plen_55_part_00
MAMIHDFKKTHDSVSDAQLMDFVDEVRSLPLMIPWSRYSTQSIVRRPELTEHVI